MEDSLKKAIEQMKNGEEKGFNEVYSATYNRVYFRARQIMKKEEDAQDLTQIVFTEAYKSIHTLQASEALYSWLDADRFISDYLPVFETTLAGNF